MAALRKLVFTTGASALMLLSWMPPAFATAGTLPGGTPITIDITSPPDSSTVPYGSDVTVTGTSSVGQADNTPHTALVYDLDVSGSTSAIASGQSGTQCGDANADGTAGTVLDCEVKSLLNLNQQAINHGTVADVGAVALGGHVGSGSGVGDSVKGDVAPTSGIQLLTTPTADLNTAGGPDVEQVLKSAFIPGFHQFTNVTAVNSNTNYEDNVIEANTDVAASTAAAKIVVLVSDGDATIGNSGLPGASSTGQFGTPTAFRNWVQAVTPDDVTFVTFAVGANAHCSPAWNGLGTLQDVAAATGGSCSQVVDPAGLPEFLPSVINSKLLGVSLDEGATSFAVTSSPSLPATGPVTADWSSTVSHPTPGAHVYCATATGSDAGGQGSVKECVHLDVVAVNPGGPYGGSSSDTEGGAVPISAILNGGATFLGWDYSAAGVDPGATCAFANASNPSTTVSCTDDGIYVLKAITDVETRTATLTLANAAPDLQALSLSATGTVFQGSAVTVTGHYTDAGANDAPTCLVDFVTEGASVAGTVTDAAGSGDCSATHVLNVTGPQTIKMAIDDLDGGSDSEQTAGAVKVVTFQINPGSGPGGSYAGVEGTAVHPSVDVPDGTVLAWSVAPAGPVDPGTSCAIDDPSSRTPAVTCNDDGAFTLHVNATLNGSSASGSLPLTIANADPVLATPTVSPTGTVLTGTSVTLTGTFHDPGTNDQHTCSVSWSDGTTSTGSVTETAGAGTCTASRTLGAPGSYTGVMTVDDGDGGTASAAADAVSAVDLVINPGSGPGGAYTGVEGSPVSPTANVPSGTSLSWSAAPNAGTDAGASCAVAGTAAAPLITCTDDGGYTITATATNGGHTSTATIPMVLGNVAPATGASSLTAAVVPLGTTVTVTTPFTDAGRNDSHTCTVKWDDALTPVAGTVTEAAGAGSCKRTDSFATPGIYRIVTSVSDDDGGSAASTYEFLVVYDPSAGFVTGGGWVNVGPGSYPTNPALSGKGTFGFESKYKKGASTPTGNTEFQFHAASFNFSSVDYQWLVVSGPKAQFKGTGTINGASGYGFLVTATDGDMSGGGGVDKYRIKIWELASGTTVFDNAMGASTDIDSANPQAISSGSIVIHAAK